MNPKLAVREWVRSFRKPITYGPVNPRSCETQVRPAATILDLPLVVDYELPGQVEPMSLLLFNRAFYPNLVRAAIAGNGVTMAESFLTRFSQKAWLLFPFGGRGFGVDLCGSNTSPIIFIQTTITGSSVIVVLSSDAHE